MHDQLLHEVAEMNNSGYEKLREQCMQWKEVQAKILTPWIWILTINWAMFFGWITYSVPWSVRLWNRANILEHWTSLGLG